VRDPWRLRRLFHAQPNPEGGAERPVGEGATFPALEIDNTNRFVEQMAACGLVWKVGSKPSTTVRLTPEGMVHVS